MLPIRTTWQLNPAHGKRNGGESLLGWKVRGGEARKGEWRERRRERRNRKSDLVAASFEAELNWQEQLIFTWGRLTELKENNKGTGVGVSLLFSPAATAICNLCWMSSSGKLGESSSLSLSWMVVFSIWHTNNNRLRYVVGCHYMTSNEIKTVLSSQLVFQC